MKKKIKEIKDFANSLGVCRNCIRNPIQKGRTRCEKCINLSRNYQAKIRLQQDRCSRCGRKKEDENYKTCKKCRNQKHE